MKPKHHFISHYPELVLHFGPLIRLWTLRFESKHAYFKQCARKLHNFKNLSSTLAERHQLLQAFLSAGNFFPPAVVVEKGTEFYLEDYNNNIRESVAHHTFEPENTLIAREVIVKGTKYKKNMFIMIDNGEEGLTLGKIKVILIHRDSAVYFITEKHLAVRLLDIGVHCLTLSQKRYCCVNQENLLDYYPLPEYIVGDMAVIVMSALGEEIKGIIVRALPNLSEETQLQLISRLQSSGLESKEDLKYVQQEDVADLLPVIQLRKLLDAFKSGIVNMARPSSLPSTSSSNLSELSSPDSRGFPSQLSKTWPETFQVPWDHMPLEIRSAIANGKRPTPAERRQMVRVLADEMRKYEANPTRSQCLTVCQKIVRQYPQSFADVFADGSLMAGGHTSLLIQVKTRIENLNRDSSFARHRTPRCSGSSSVRKRGPTDTYGCTRFQPDLPPSETDDSVEQKRQRLEEIHRQEGASGVERAEVCSLMETTFCLLRRHINAIPVPTIEDIRSKWPYLFNQRCIYAHFELLTDLNVLRLLELAMEECGRVIIEYFQSKSTNKDVQAVLSQGENTDVALNVVQLLMAYFTETTNGLILLADVNKILSEITLISHSGGTERVTAGRWMISLEGHVLFEGIQPTFVTGLPALFSVYYIFNLQYQDEAACTLEFIQRRFIGINPERGTKASRGKTVSKRTGRVVQKKSVTVNPRVSTLLKNLIDFEPAHTSS
uniref:Uncharacterized protein n=1 Tax=Amphiprion percula TaxID=161767 RepID=A0A3P8S3X7_AMPPE